MRIKQEEQQTGQAEDVNSQTTEMEVARIQAYQALPPAASARRLDFDHAEVIALRTFPPRYVLRVSGIKPYANMDVDLVPLTYIRQPDYWEIEVVAWLRGIGLPASAPYAVSRPLLGTLGTSGIEVAGATRRQRFDIPDGQPSHGDCRHWAAWTNRMPPGPAILHVAGECQFPSGGFAVELRRHAPQGVNPRYLLLDKIVTRPDGPATAAITTVEVRYREETTAGFDAVTILPDGPTIRVWETW